MAKVMRITEQSPSPRVDMVPASIPNVPVTELRQPYVAYDGSALKHPGVPRANLAPSAEKPEGSTENDWARKHAHQSVIQQHCDFFDRDHDGIVWPQDTFVGFNRLGFGYIFSFFALLVIHINFSYPTCPGWLPDPFFRLYLVNAHKTKHGSDSGAFDHEGRFLPQKFEDIFTKYGDGRDYLTFWDLTEFLKGQRCISDPIGWCGAIFEWSATYLMLWPEDGRIMKEDVRAIFDGSIFQRMADKVEKKRGKGGKQTKQKKKW